ncbi:MAG: UDP-N-acetylmuramoyl-L-alanine--D-glutamate ligase [Brevinematales bacterium]|nr:UDP-N-acetylmuramoyl-L-alanine--D-glutamate ligase [Brevinematales bacterium]
MVLGKENFLILGFTNRTGFYTSKFLLSQECNVYISDRVNDEEKQKLIAELENVSKGKVINLLGKEDIDLEKVEMVISSPGVPLTNPIIQKALSKGIEVIGDIELFYRLKPQINYVAITGTDGKTTTTSLTYKLLSSFLPKVHMGGNVGIPVFSLINEEINILVLEISSFQIDTTKLFKPHIGVITNIAKDHLDRYPTFNDYVNSKFSLFKNSDENDFSIINKSITKFDQASGLKTKRIYFSAYQPKENFNNIPQVYLENNYVYFEDEKVLDVSKVKLIGKHNIENIMVAVSVGVLHNLPIEVIQESIYSFEPLPHRMELVGEIDGVKYINDSKSTTINAMISAIRSLDDEIILIVGGLDKGMDFEEAVPIIKHKVKYLVAIGSTKENISKKLKESGYYNYYLAETLEDAVKKAKEVSEKGDVILFSPGYASFDMFRNYEDRGNKFKEIIYRV